MGLDQYAMRISVKPATPTDFEAETEPSELHYWRKHPNLHGWMEQLYRAKGGNSESFNCTPVELTLDDISLLEEHIKSGELPSTRGFFFGESSGDENEVNEDLEFCKAARKAIEAGDFVYYDSWW